MKKIRRFLLTLAEEVLLLKREGALEEAFELIAEAEEDKLLDAPEINWALNLLV